MKQFAIDLTYELNLYFFCAFFGLGSVQVFMSEMVHVFCFMQALPQVSKVFVKIRYIYVYIFSLLKIEVLYR